MSSRNFASALIAGAAAAAVVALASHAEQQKGPQNPIAYHPPGPPPSCAAGFAQSGAAPGPSGGSFTCTAHVVCQKGPTTAQSISASSKTNGSTAATLSYTCSYFNAPK